MLSRAVRTLLSVDSALQYPGHVLDLCLFALLVQSLQHVFPAWALEDHVTFWSYRPKGKLASHHLWHVGSKTKAAQSQGAFTDDRLYAFEAAGQLLGMEDLAADEQEAAVRSLLQPLQQQIDEQLASAGKTSQGGLSSLCSVTACLN